MGTKELWIKLRSRSPMRKGNFEGKGAAHCKVQRPPVVSCAKTAEPIEMPFEMLSGVGPRKHVLDGVHIGVT